MDCDPRIAACMATRGFTNPDYLLMLLEACRDTDVPGCTVEVGCFMGRSTIALCKGLEERKLGENLLVIDSFSAPEEDPDLANELKAIYKPDEAFGRAMATAGLKNYQLIMEDSQEDATWDKVPGKIRFAHIDGDHSYEGVKNDLEHVLLKSVPGTVVAIDDYHNRNWDWGVYRAVNEVLMPRANRHWTTKSGEQILVEVGA